ncbi:hypothetical protein CcI49_36175 [Frankia sp. CcI49]|uniref:DUF2278 family protein n=1 Tax=unclassified Frankia TaxID=2632575 RepID=UPI0006CA2779|nr:MULTISPECIES: DUF2278 family protein [unclassified Frankia]KPM50782.1 hypothetical protein ACG83_37715 [Frankia sp. R43]ONH51080.1 hypothetical protein CcI49_36175 [Frankia sp. CcI49]
MPLAGYGVLIGTLDRFAREDPNDFGSWYHGKMYVNAPAGQYECAVDVSTPSGVPIQYREVRNLDEALFAPVAALGPGWHVLARDATSGALDYLRSPLLRGRGCVTVIANPLITLVNSVLRSPRFGWVESTADNALDLLEKRLTGCQQVYVFGAPYNHGLGVHDIHLNQGDPPGDFQRLDGIWQDGGTIIRSASGELNAFLTKFKPQVLNTDDNGLPV